VTAWHLGDWVFNDLSPEQRQRFGFTKTAELFEHVRTECRALHLCRHAATASKHWEVTKHPDPNVQIVVSADDGGWGIDFVDGDKKIPADQIFEEALGFWTKFIYANRIAKSDWEDGADTPVPD
jgi:hypothetical protein